MHACRSTLEDPTGQSATDVDAGVVYVFGTNAAGVAKLYSLDLATGALLASPEAGSAAATGLQLNSAGELVAFRWNADLEREEMVVVDPASGTGSVRGVVGDLMWWSGVTALNRTTDEHYVIGTNGDLGVGEDRLYVMDSGSGALLYDVPVADYATTMLLVY